MVGTGKQKQGDGNVVDLDAFRRHSEDRKLRELFGPDPLPAHDDVTGRERNEARDEPPRERVGGLVVEVGLDVWPGTSPLDGLVASADDRDHGLIAECRDEALADEDESLDLDDMEHGTTVLRAFLTRLGDRGLPLAGPGPLSEYAVALIMLDIDPIGTWKGEPPAATPQHPVRRVRSAAPAIELVPS